MATRSAQTVLAIGKLFRHVFLIAERGGRRVFAAYKVRVGGPR